MKKTSIGVILSLLLLGGCVAHVTPDGTYLEPLPATIIVGPPVIVPPPPRVVVRPLPPVVVVPQRHVYHYGGLYYYNWDGAWYYGEREKGPWHRLPGEYHPKKYKQHKYKKKWD